MISYSKLGLPKILKFQSYEEQFILYPMTPFSLAETTSPFFRTVHQLFAMEADPEVDIMLLNTVQGIRRVDDVVGEDGLRVERSARIIRV